MTLTLLLSLIAVILSFAALWIADYYNEKNKNRWIVIISLVIFSGLVLVYLA